MRSVYKMAQDKLTGDMEIKNSAGGTILKLDIIDSDSEVTREPTVN
jgi:hypothetical protein